MGLGVRKEGSACSLWWQLLEERLEAFLMGKSQAREVSKLLNTWGRRFHTRVVSLTLVIQEEKRKPGRSWLPGRYSP